MRNSLLLLFTLFICNNTNAQNIFPTSGNTGIGTLTPSQKLEVNGNAIFDNQSSNHTHIKIGHDANDNIISDNSNEKHYGGGYFFRVHNETIPHKYIDALLISENGNIGIGTATPSNDQGWARVLDVAGNDHSKILVTNSNATYKTGIFSHNNWHGGGGFLGTESNHNLHLITGYTPRISILTNGDTGIGTLTPSNDQGWARVLDVAGNDHSKILATNSNATYKTGIFSHNNWHGGGGFLGTESNHNLHLITGYTPRISILTNGDTGIGTLTPSQKLEVNGNIIFDNQSSNHTHIKIGHNANDNIISDNSNEKHYGGGYFFRVHNETIPHKYIDALLIGENGNVGIGGKSSNNKFEVYGNTSIGGADLKLGMSDGQDQGKILDQRALVHGNNDELWVNYMSDFEGGTRIGKSAIIRNNGDTALQGRLEVKEIKITTTPTADFVFEENYNLPKLEEVEKHIKTKKHLPEIASANQMQQEGVNIGEFQIKLLQKIEELTLYSIEQNKKIEKQSKKIEEQNKRIIDLEKRINSTNK
ncbi:coiled-coil domain-containing protein [Flavobacterium covae]|uniref:hypothetical protein n=1 Tax=Flavobacterium covae TaxID=2906076 RepID=UPI000745EB3D|nr:hypothetical protein [Flavobacterium covae]AMA50102.1 hypothetical protein AWN65_11840 [Flavobacterium covae]MCJ1810254.1 hypothetical protein [Flavobacterium covae]